MVAKEKRENFARSLAKTQQVAERQGDPNNIRDKGQRKRGFTRGESYEMPP